MLALPSAVLHVILTPPPIRRIRARIFPIFAVTAAEALQRQLAYACAQVLAREAKTMGLSVECVRGPS